MKVFLYPRSPRPNGAARSPWAIKKLGKRARSVSTSANTPNASAKKEDAEKPAVDPEIAERMDEEAKILRGLNHPNIIGFRGFKRNSDGSRILAVENGDRSLQDIIEEWREECEDSVGEDDEDEVECLDEEEEDDEEESKKGLPVPLAADKIEKVSVIFRQSRIHSFPLLMSV